MAKPLFGTGAPFKPCEIMSPVILPQIGALSDSGVEGQVESLTEHKCRQGSVGMSGVARRGLGLRVGVSGYKSALRGVDTASGRIDNRIRMLAWLRLFV